MRRGLDWYKREPRAFLDGCRASRMTERQWAIYAIVIDLIYDHGGETPDDPKHIASYLADIGTASVRNTIQQLIDMGKLFRVGDFLHQERAENQAKTRGNLSENRAETGRLGGISSGNSRRAAKKIKEIAEANASSKHEAEKEKIRGEGIEETSSSIPKEEEEARAKPLLDQVMEAVGIDPASPPKYWRGPAAKENLGIWLALGLTPAEIVAVAVASRVDHPDPPDGPKALDGVMSACATQKRQAKAKKPKGSKPLAPPPAPPKPDQQREADERLAQIIKRGAAWAANTVGIAKAQSLLRQGLVTEAELRACGVAW